MAAEFVLHEEETADDYSVTDVFQYLSNNLKGFIINKCFFNDQECLILTHEKLFLHPPLGPTSRVRILLKRREYVVHVLLREVQNGFLTSDSPGTEFVEICSKFAVDSSKYKFCPGIDIAEYEEFKSEIRFDLKSVRRTNEPFLRIDSVNCLLWFELGKTCSYER
uniref:Uncharacterized protein n=1 Tax=Amphimedon queenslandica TaxID=400682 RepID=A0A1X7U4E8_AMPQE